MLQLNEDKNFHYEAIRALARARTFSADIAEVLSILDRIKPGDFNSWYDEWYGLAMRVLSTIDENRPEAYSPVTLRDIYFRVSHYIFVSDFFLHGNPNDPRIGKCYEEWRMYFDKANALLPIPGVHATVKSQYGFEMPIITYRAPEASSTNPRPTVILGGGFDSNMEELLHVFGFPALERGYNVIIYEGPGQPTLLHKEKKGFIVEWERAVTAIVDYILENSKSELSFIDTSKIGLLGYSLGGYLAARAAAFEPRLAALICIDGVWSVSECFEKAIPQCKPALESGDKAALTEIFESISDKDTTNLRWIHDHCKYSFQSTDIPEIFERSAKMTLEGIVDRIEMPAFIGDAEADIFFQGQPPRVAKAIGSNATLFPFTNEQAAGAHCQSGAFAYLNQAVMEWFAGVVGH